MEKFYLLICGLTGLFAYAQNTGLPMRDANGSIDNNATPNPQTIVETVNPSEISFNDVRELSEINYQDGQGYPWISGDGLRLYFMVNNSIGNSWVRYSERQDTSSDFSTPIPVLPNLPITPISIWISNDELQAFVCNMFGTVFHLHRNSISETFGTPVPFP